jgi:hypothetical protein
VRSFRVRDVGVRQESTAGRTTGFTLSAAVGHRDATLESISGSRCGWTRAPVVGGKAVDATLNHVRSYGHFHRMKVVACPPPPGAQVHRGVPDSSGLTADSYAPKS